jgi:ketosteroid isomerase-like protein
MVVEAEFVRRIFAGLEHGDGAAFFEHVADDVDWTVMGTHPLAGHYKSRAEFTAATFAKLGRVLPGGAQLNVNDVFIAGDVAIVELHSRATAKNGFRFDDHYCWVCYFRNNKIIRVRAYLDSAMVARLFAENPF